MVGFICGMLVGFGAAVSGLWFRSYRARVSIRNTSGVPEDALRLEIVGGPLDGQAVVVFIASFPGSFEYADDRGNLHTYRIGAHYSGLLGIVYRHEDSRPLAVT